MRALKSHNLGQKRVDTDVRQVEHFVGDGLVRAEAGVVVAPLEDWRQLHKNRSSRRIDSRRLFSREKDYEKTFSGLPYMTSALKGGRGVLEKQTK